MTDPAVLVVGAGPAGLTAAFELASRGIGPVLVVDREAEAGGVPRHCEHNGFGLQDLHRSMSGPAYARRLARRAERAGVRVRLRTTATALGDDGSISLGRPGWCRATAPPGCSPLDSSSSGSRVGFRWGAGRWWSVPNTWPTRLS